MSIPGAASPLFIGAAAGAAAAYQIDRSLRFNSADSAYLNRTPSSAGNRNTWTLSWWMKRSKLSNNFQTIFGVCDASATYYTQLRFASNDKLSYQEKGSANGVVFETEMVFRDVASWYHCVFVFNNTASSSSEKARLYVNGSEVTSFSTDNRSQIGTTPTAWNNNVQHNISHMRPYSGSFDFDGYLAEVHFVDGTALDASDFGEYDDNNVWQPKAYAGTYGTNGFHLDFSDNSSAAALGYDAAGSNDWDVTNISATEGTDYIGTGTYTESEWDSTNKIENVFDGNDSTLAYRPNSAGAGTSTFTFGVTVTVTSSLQIRGWKGDSNERIFANGVDISSHFNTQSGGGLSTQDVTSTVGSTPFTLTSVGSENQNNRAGALAKIIVDGTTLINGYASDMDSLIDTPTNYEAESGNNGGNYATLNPLESALTGLNNGNLNSGSSGAASWKICTSTMAVSSGKYYWEGFTDTTADSSNGWQFGFCQVGPSSLTTPYGTGKWSYQAGNIYNQSSTATSVGTTAVANDLLAYALDTDAGTCKLYVNNSLVHTFTGITGTVTPFVGSYNSPAVTVNFGQRPFVYTPPTGFLSLCTTNLTDPTIADGSTAMDVTLYTGTRANQVLTFGMQPDFVWAKNRSQSLYNHVLTDSVRGASKVIFSNLTNAEQTSNSIIDWDYGTNQVQLGDYGQSSETGDSYVAWAWDAGTSTASNTDGSITSNVRANASAGFSIVTWTAASNSVNSIGHGLNAAPEFIIAKSRSNANNWRVYTAVTGKDKYLGLNSTFSATTFSNFWSTSEPTSSTFGVWNAAGAANNDGDMVAYCFAPVEGFSAFGSYTANGSSDGPFVFTGFRPALVIFKASSKASSWNMFDSTRAPENVVKAGLLAESANAEFSSSDRIDILSNGFKVRSGTAEPNASGETYLYMAWAEHPFATARAR